MNEKPLERISFREKLIINIPAMLFLLFLPVSALLYFTVLHPLSLVPAIWGISGFILLLHDYYSRKKDLYLRLSRLTDHGCGCGSYLTSTLCGYCMIRALGVRKK